MARKSIPLVLTEDDEKRLIEIARGPDEEIAKRAQIVLACKDTVQNKDVAEKFHVAASTVGYWKEAYRDRGINGIEYTKPGSKERVLSFDLDEEVLKAASSKKWTITGLAKHLGAPVDQVEKSLERQHLSIKRTTRWIIRTLDSVAANSVELVGVWLGKGHGILITCTNEFGIATRHGELVTSSSSLSKALSQRTVALENAIIEASYHNDPVRSSNDGKAAAFLEDYFQSAPILPNLCYQVFGFGETIPRIPQGRLSDTSISWNGSMKEWLEDFRQWVGIKGSGAKHIWAEQLCDAITAYFTSGNQEMWATFRWSKAIERIGTMESPIKASDEAHDSTGEAASQQLLRLLSECDDEESEGLSVDFTVSVRGKGTQSYFVTSTKVLDDVEQFSFDNLNEMLCSIDTVESPITEAARKAEQEAIRLSIEELKKRAARRIEKGPA